MNIAIWGLGISGLAALDLVDHDSDNVFVIDRGEPLTWKNIDQVRLKVPLENCFDQGNIATAISFDLIILSPGVDPRIPELKRFESVEKICEVERAYQLRGDTAPIIAVTGTNGKTTTVTLMARALELAGKKVFLGGNIGTPFAYAVNSSENYDYIVLELSSFQLELLSNFRANFACILNITPSHMERYDSFKDYEAAKMNIQDNQKEGDLFLAPERYFKVDSKGKKERMDLLEGFDWEHSLLKGDHYKENFFPVKRMLEYFSIQSSDEIIQKLINEFPGVSYRQQFVGEKNGLKFYNDSKSTNMQSTVTALKSFSSSDVYLILGGKRRTDSQKLDQVKMYTNIKKVFAIGDAQDEIFNQLNNTIETIKSENLNRVFEALNDEENGIVLFSPAYPSFDQFENYIERGKYFDQLVAEF